jgi:polyferredoxin
MAYYKVKLPALVFLFTFLILAAIQLIVEKPMLLLERFSNGGGWIEIVLLCSYGAFLFYKMHDAEQSAKWRIRSWSIFSIFFFSQLVLGIIADERFLLTGKLHIPVPAMMISGPIYRGQLSIMTLLFLSTIILSGPAWCSQLCYFGAIDGLASSNKKGKTINKWPQIFLLKALLLTLVILATLLLRWSNVSALRATYLGIGFGMIGVLIILFFSLRRGKMIHCIAYCPIGTLVNIFKYISPFRMYIDNTLCTMCMRCTPTCKYDALKPIDLRNKKPGITCTLCGDCLKSCGDNAIHYKIFKTTPATSRSIYLFITISLHVIFMAMGRI